MDDSAGFWTRSAPSGACGAERGTVASTSKFVPPMVRLPACVQRPAHDVPSRLSATIAPAAALGTPVPYANDRPRLPGGRARYRHVRTGREGGQGRRQWHRAGDCAPGATRGRRRTLSRTAAEHRNDGGAPRCLCAARCSRAGHTLAAAARRGATSQYDAYTRDHHGLLCPLHC